MTNKYPEYKQLDLPVVADEILEKWNKENTFYRSIEMREGQPQFIFYEGPPSANGLPGIHHVMARTIKDIFCRYKTLKGFQVKRKAGWDTHGLPVELGVEKELGITKENIGTKISVEDYNNACRKAVMRYTDIWNDLTLKMGYWVDIEHPYITYDNKYIESVWWLLKQLYNKNLLYKGYTIQPYSPKAGTGLSTHELNQPGCYKNVKDTTITSQFKINKNKKVVNPLAEKLLNKGWGDAYILAWTTTPWTLPSNTALAVGKKISYVLIETYNQYTFQKIQVVLAEVLVSSNFSGKYCCVESENDIVTFNKDDKKIPYRVIDKCTGEDLIGLWYEQLLPFALPYENAENAFQVIEGDFITTEDGTGIVHIAPTFGADDMRAAQKASVPPMLVLDDTETPVPLVNLQGKFTHDMGFYAGKYVKNEYYPDGEAPERSVDIEIVIQLKEENKAFKAEKYEHSYPHCWRTDKPILYYPLDSWFVKTTAAKKRMVELNNTINWKPSSTGTGRFGNWLENLNDWNLSRSRFWGIPLPIWRTEDKKENLCIGSAEELKSECEKSVRAGLMQSNPLEAFVPGNMEVENYLKFDMHKNYMDDIILVSPDGQPMCREQDLIDVWFDSGSVPYAQMHYPFENKDNLDKYFPADFIAEGVDQTRGWFYTLHAIATMVFDSVAYKNVISNGLVLDKNGLKMSKRLGNTVDPFETINKFGPDATRWYMISNAQPWDNLKFNKEGIAEVQRKFFRALYNSYAFFALYANVDNFSTDEPEIPLADRPEIDRWIISRLNSLILNVDANYADYEPTKVTRAIQEFVVDDLSNWYVRLCRKRFWRGSYSTDKIAAYQTLFYCLEKVSLLAAPIAPFFMDKLFRDLTRSKTSIHLHNFPVADANNIDDSLEYRMGLAQKIASMVLRLRKKENLKVRQPLQKIMIPVLEKRFITEIPKVKDLILTEVNIKELELIDNTSGKFVKQIRLNFRSLGKKYPTYMKEIIKVVKDWGSSEIEHLEFTGKARITINNEELVLDISNFEISTNEIPGWIVATEDNLTVALDVTMTEELKNEGIAREMVNRIQNLRKSNGYEVTDHIIIKIMHQNEIVDAINKNLNYICSETLADTVEYYKNNVVNDAVKVEIDNGIETFITIRKN